jgi:hypothetical protein
MHARYGSGCSLCALPAQVLASLVNSPIRQGVRMHQVRRSRRGTVYVGQPSTDAQPGVMTDGLAAGASDVGG